MKRISILLMMLTALFAPLAMNGQTTANVVSGGTGTNQYIPMYNWYNDYGFRSEYIIPASYFTSAGLTNGDILKSITLYRSATDTWESATMTIQLTNTTTSYYSNTSFLGKNGTTVYTTSSYNGGTSSSYTFNFSSDFEYTGGSLVVHIYATSGGTATSSSTGSTWLGYSNTTNNQALYSYGSSAANATSGTAQTFIPNTTFTYIHPSGNPITLTQPANGTISVSVNGGTASTSTTYAEAGQSVTLTATANSGYSFDSWNVSGVTGTANGSTYTFTMPDNAVTVTASIIPTSGGTNTTTVWTETSSITANTDYLIGLTNNNSVYLIVNYAVDETNHYYTNSSQTYYGYTAQASFDANGHVTGVSGYATDLQYCKWQFSSTSGGTIKSSYQNNYYLNTYTSTSYADLYPGTSTNQTWAYSSGKLSRTISNTPRYAVYYALNSNNHMQVTSTEPSSNVKLYTQTTTTTYAITATASPAAGGTVSGLDYYASGATCTLTATPNADYVFVNWTENGSVVSTDATYSFTVSSARTLVANFTTLGAYHITCNTTTGGTISASPTAADENTLITITATPNPGYELTALSYNDGSDHSIAFSNNQGTFTMPASDVTVSATFTAINYTVTCAFGLTGGSISASPYTNVHYGDLVTITATPDTGYELAAITVTDANDNEVTVTINGNTGTFTMPASNVNVTAVFSQGFNVIVEQTANGTVTATPTSMLHSGDIVNVTATPDTDCVLLAWYVYKTGDPRAVISVVNNSFFFMPASDVTVQAIFVTQNEVNQPIGSGTNTNPYIPTYVGANYSLTQQIYLASELDNQKGTITKIAYRATTASTTRNLDIYIRHTDQSTFASTTDWTTMGPSFNVFSGNVTFRTDDWTTIELDTPFEYDGTSNIIICVVDNTGSTASNITQFYRYDATNRALYANGTSAYTNVNYSGISGYTGTLLSYVNRINLTMLVPGSAESITISPDEIRNFSYVEGQGPSNVEKIGVVGVDLNNNITVTAPTNFEICLTEDGTYTSSLTIPRATSKRGRNVTTWDFESDLNNWTTVDADGDGYNWYRNTSTAQTHNGSSGCVTSESYNQTNYLALTPDNWLISPQVELGGTFSIWASPQDAAWPQEHFGIFVSTTDSQTSSFLMLNEWTCDAGVWKQYSVDLSGFAGQMGYIAVRHFNCTDKYRLNVDDFELDTEATLTIEMPVVITPATVFVRMKDNLSVGTYSGTLTASAGSGTNVNGSVSLSGEVITASWPAAVTSLAATSSGYSESGDNITISNANGLAWLISTVNGLNGQSAAFRDKTITLTADVDMSAHDWVPIGTTDRPFTCTFDGNGHIIKGVTCSTELPHKGLFGYVSGAANIQNVVVQAELTGNSITTGAIAGTFASTGTISNVEGAGTLTSGASTTSMGGLVGNNTSGTIHSSFAVNTITTNNASTYVGGLVGNNTGNLLNCYANTTISGAGQIGGLVGTNTGTVENCYAVVGSQTFPAFAYENATGGAIQYCYADNANSYIGSGTNPTGHGTYSTTENTHTYGYMYWDNTVSVEGGETNSYKVDTIKYDNNQIDRWPGLLSTLEYWVESTNKNTSLFPAITFTKWLRPTTKFINNDLPVLCFPSDNCMLTIDSEGKALRYGPFDGNSHSTYISRGDYPVNNGVDDLLEENPSGYLFVYDNAINVERVPNANLYVFINEDVVFKQAATAGAFINTQVGVSFDNSCGKAKDFFGNKLAYDWHMLSTPLADAPLGINYNGSAQNWWETGDNTQVTSVSNSYMPNGTGNDGHWDLYSFYEPQYHWINLKRNSSSHYHYDEPHDRIYYDNETIFVPGKGYMAAIDKDSYLCHTGTLNGPTNPVSVTLTKRSPSPGTDELGFNLLGNPYQAYLDVNKFLGDNSLSSYWVYIAESDNYVAGNADASTNPVLPSATLHPHQGFFVLASSDNQTVNFDYSTMALSNPEEHSYFRGDKVNYPLLNLFVANDNDMQDLAVIEFNRPKIGGSKKMRAINNANFELAAFNNGERYSILFTEKGVRRVPVTFVTNEDGEFTMTWSTMHGQFTQLFLFDNITGVRTDMLSSDHYTFNGSINESAWRFYIEFNNIDDDDDDTESDDFFAWFDGNDWIVNGKGQLQLFDVMGHVLQSQVISNEQTRLHLNNYAAGMYMLHLSNGKTSKFQKIVVR